MLLRVLVSASTLLLATSQLAAQMDPCTERVVSRGNNVTGRTLTVARDYPGVTASALFEWLRAALSTPQGQLGAVQLTRSDPARGVISGSVTPRGATRAAALEATVAVLPSGNAQVSLTNRLPAAMFVSSREWAVANCAFLATLTGSTRVPVVASASSGPAAAQPGAVAATDEARAAREGTSYFEVVAGTIAREEEIDRFRLRGNAGDTVRVWTDDPRYGNDREGIGFWSHLKVKTSVRDLGAARTLPREATGNVILRGTGPFEVRVESDGAAVPYVLEVTQTSNRPEHAAARITTTDTIRGERIDYPDDTDAFLFTGRAGEEIQVYLGDKRSIVYGVYRAGAGPMDDALPRGSAGIIRLPVDGTYMLRIVPQGLNSDPNWTGPYWFRLRRRD
jgi:hypothetical protein